MSLPRYPKYRDSGVEWLGEVPAGWATSRLGFEAWVRARLGWKGLKAEEYVDDGYAFLSTPNLKASAIDFLDVNYITQERYDESPEIKLSVGDVLLVKDGATLGIVNSVRQLPRPTTVNGSIAVITPGKHLDSLFLSFLLASSYLQQVIQRVKGGMGVPHLFQSDINRFYVPLPPAEEQRRIGAFLDRETAKIDALVAEQQRLIDLLKEKRQAVISHAVTKGLNPGAPMKDSGIEWLGEVPAHWDVIRLRRVGRVDQGNAFSHSIQGEEVGDLPWFKVGDMNLPGNEVEMHRASNYVSASVADAAGVGMFPAGTIIFPRVGAALLTNKRRLLTEPSIVDDNVYGFVPSRIEARFVYLTFLLLDMARLCSPGLVPTVTFSVIKDHSVVCPPASEQAAIVEYLDKLVSKLDTLTAEAERAIDLLQERRTALISAAVTGQIDVRPTAERGSA